MRAEKKQSYRSRCSMLLGSQGCANAPDDGSCCCAIFNKLCEGVACLTVSGGPEARQTIRTTQNETRVHVSNREKDIKQRGVDHLIHDSRSSTSIVKGKISPSLHIHQLTSLSKPPQGLLANLGSTSETVLSGEIPPSLLSRPPPSVGRAFSLPIVAATPPAPLP